MLEKDRAEQARHGELDLVDMPLADRVQLDPVIGELLAQPGDVLGVAGKAVERLADDDVDLAVLDRAQQLLQARPVAAIA